MADGAVTTCWGPRDRFALWAFHLLYDRSDKRQHPLMRFCSALSISARYAEQVSDEQVTLWERCITELRALRSALHRRHIDRCGYVSAILALFGRHFPEAEQMAEAGRRA